MRTVNRTKDDEKMKKVETLTIVFGLFRTGDRAFQCWGKHMKHMKHSELSGNTW